MILKGLWAYNIFVSLVATREVLPYTANEWCQSGSVIFRIYNLRKYEENGWCIQMRMNVYFSLEKIWQYC